jgi:dsDNA-binding SOS-regulon protein
VKYTVSCTGEADSQLATIWMNADDREAVLQAAQTLDDELERTPLESGESREEGFRIAFSSPLGVRYRVSEADRLVVIVSFWRY